MQDQVAGRRLKYRRQARLQLSFLRLVRPALVEG